ncbi:MAG: hypothetical protein RLZZ292_753 [Bacteroidota bacterium]
MPIRMVQDDPNENQDDQNNSNNDVNQQDTSGGGGGLGSMLGFLPIILGVFGKSPKLLLFIAVIGAIWYFGGKGCASASDDNGITNRGCEMKTEEYDKAEVFEPLDPNQTTLPDAVSLLKYAPPRGDQGQQGSCVGWGSAYAARTILEAASRGQSGQAVAFSPAFLYNQISLEGCQGSYISKAMEVMTKQGALPYNEFPYTDESCSRRPDGNQIERAGQYRMRGYNRLTEGGNVYKANLDAIKQNLAQGGPVVVGMNVTQSFTSKMFGQKVWHPTQAEYMGQGNLGGHCMCLIGYDDKLEGGAFQIMNSWTPKWGENGVAWVKYSDFAKFDVESYGLYPMPKRDAAANQKFAIQLGLLENTTKKYIPLAVSSQNLFKTVQPIAKGTKFKIAVNNPVECYTYVFGQETDNSSYVLFPYNKKHSPFCGITGQRVFPRTESLQADQTGNKDFMAVVVTKQALDYVKLNAAINASRQGSYQAKLMEALGAQAINNVRFAANANGIIGFECDTQENQAVAMIIEVDKK